MRVPIRKPGKYTHLKPDPCLTIEKFKELKDKLEKMKKKRFFLIEEVKQTALDGDFSENAPYQIAKGRLRGLNQRILETEELLKKAEIIQRPNKKGFVCLGSIVRIIAGNQEREYKILGSSEADPSKNIISQNSPIGKALMGKRAGEEFFVNLAKGEVKYRIIEIR